MSPAFFRTLKIRSSKHIHIFHITIWNTLYNYPVELFTRTFSSGHVFSGATSMLQLGGEPKQLTEHGE